MNRFLTMTATAASLALMLGVHAAAQQIPSQTAQPATSMQDQAAKAEHAQATFTGCLKAGTEAKSYILDQAAPAKTGEAVGTTGELANATKFDLVASDQVNLQENVGHKVEVTGTLSPAKPDTKAMAPGPEAAGAKMEKSATPQLHVSSIKQLPDSCSL
jgi:hypothetical protein